MSFSFHSCALDHCILLFSRRQRLSRRFAVQYACGSGRFNLLLKFDLSTQLFIPLCLLCG
jgi:hypothetical protein